MRPYPPELYDDAALLAEFQSYRAARKSALSGQIAVIAGEGRRLEYAPTQLGEIDRELREIGVEARERGLTWAGQGGAISVEIG
jgi:hypothetical protein